MNCYVRKVTKALRVKFIIEITCGCGSCSKCDGRILVVRKGGGKDGGNRDSPKKEKLKKLDSNDRNPLDSFPQTY